MPLTRKAIALVARALRHALRRDDRPGSEVGLRRPTTTGDRRRQRRLVPEVRRLGAPRGGHRQDGAADRQGGRQEGGPIGYLHTEKAELAVAEAKIQAEGQGACMKAEARGRRPRLALVDRGPERERPPRAPTSLRRGGSEGPGRVRRRPTPGSTRPSTPRSWPSPSWIRPAGVADEHTIKAPFAGQILQEFKHEGESVGAREPVVEIGNLDTVRVWAYIPVEYAYPGQARHRDRDRRAPRLGEVEVTGRKPIEQKRFAAISRSIQEVQRRRGQPCGSTPTSTTPTTSSSPA